MSYIRPAAGRIPLLIVASFALGVSACGDGESNAPVVARAAIDPPRDDRGVLVDVAGHVRRPGVYRLASGARVHEAIAAAGGVRPGARLESLNRAAPVVDGQQVLVPDGREPSSAAAAAASHDASASTAAVSINSADASALDALPGIGPVTAERIVAERTESGPFASVDDLDRVPGIGPATVEALRDVVTT